MNPEDFQLTDIETMHNSIKWRGLLKIYHQQAADINDSDQNIELIFGENNNYHQIRNAYLQYEMTLGKDVAVAVIRVPTFGDAIRLVNTALAHCFKEDRLNTTGGSDIEHNNYCRQISSIMRGLTSKAGDLLSHFEKIDKMNHKLKLKIHLLNIILLTTTM